MDYMSSVEIAVSLQTAKFEQTYQRALQDAERIFEEERARALRIQLLLLTDEKDSLQEQMVEDEDEMQNLESTNDELREQLASAESELRNAQIESKANLRDLDRFKAEIKALNVASSDSNKLFSEKLALSRELASMKPQLEHLKTQANTQQNTLGEKLALERELAAVQIELENEKRTVQRMKTQEKSAGAMDNSLVDELEESKKELAKERRNAQKLERESMKKCSEWEGQKEALEGKLEAFRNKLRATKEQLKEAQDELEKAQTAKFQLAAEATKARMNGNANPRKRNVARFDPDMTIGTPGHGAQASKRQRNSVMPGDKSAFSITPLLNKTMSILPESPSGDAGENAEISDVPSATATTTISKKTAKETPQVSEKVDHEVGKKRISKKASNPSSSSALSINAGQPLKETTNPKANVAIKVPSLPVVSEEDEDDHEDVGTINKSTKGPARSSDNTNINKKKLGNRPTLFDDDEENAPKRAAPKKLNLAGLRGGNTSLLGSSKVMLGNKSKVLAEFSPLKKDRKTVVV